MILIKEISSVDIESCFDLDSKTISLWSKKQWDDEFKKEGMKIFGLSYSNFFIGACALQIVLDEGQLNFFAINNKFRRQGFGTHLMKFLIKKCEKLKINKILLEVSESNHSAESFYNHFDFNTVGIRKKYYNNGSNALLKEKILIKK